MKEDESLALKLSQEGEQQSEGNSLHMYLLHVYHVTCVHLSCLSISDDKVSYLGESIIAVIVCLAYSCLRPDPSPQSQTTRECAATYRPNPNGTEEASAGQGGEQSKEATRWYHSMDPEEKE